MADVRKAPLARRARGRFARARANPAPKLRWPHTVAGGTGAAEGKHGYETERLPVGYYRIAPFSWPNGRHRGYVLHFVNDRGALAGGLWQELGTHSSPNKAKGRALEHYRQLLNAKRLEGWRDAPATPAAPAAANPSAKRTYRCVLKRRGHKPRTVFFASSSDANAVRYAVGLLQARHPGWVAASLTQIKKNPVSEGELERADDALEAFTGERTRRWLRAPAPKGGAGWALGKLTSIGYIATRDGETAEYVHEFRSSSRPQLASSADGSQLYLLGGAYSVTERGIVDKRR